MKTRLMELRKKAGFKNRDEFANEININKHTYRTWEVGSTIMSLEQACLVADKLDCTLDELVGRSIDAGQPSDIREKRMLNDFRILGEIEKDAALAALDGMAASARAQGEAARNKVAKVS